MASVPSPQKNWSPVLWSVALLFGATATVIALQWPRSDLALRSKSALTAAPVLPDPTTAKILSLGLGNLWADWYWLQFVQYFGDVQARDQTNFDYCDDYLTLITTLDPQFTGAYAASAYSVAEMQEEPQKALDLMEKGIRLNEGKKLTYLWYLYQRAAGVSFLYLKDTRKAAQYLEKASREPGAPKVLGSFAASFYGATNDLERAIPLRINFYLSAPNAEQQKRGQQKLKDMAVWLDLWGPRPATLMPSKEFLTTLKLGNCTPTAFTPLPVPGFKASYLPLTQIQSACRVK